MSDCMVNPYPFKTADWYAWTHDEASAMHDVFRQWLAPRMSEIETVAEVGCGLHPNYARLLKDKQYLGIDHDQAVVQARQADPDKPEWHRYVCADFCELPYNQFITSDVWPRPDLLFSRAVIDHVRDPDEFLRNACRFARNWIYVMTYRPYDEQLTDHQITKGPDGYWYNDLAPDRIRQVLAEFHPRHAEVRSQPTGRHAPQFETEIHIIVEL